MPIRFHVAPGAESVVTVGTSPLLEAMISLHVLVDPRHHPHQHPWVRSIRPLDQRLQREIRAFRFAVKRIWPAYLFPTEPEIDVEADFERLEATPVDQLATALLRPLYSDGPRGPHDPSWRLEARSDRRVLAAARLYGADVECAARLLIDDPERGVVRFRTFVRSYWHQVFGVEWPRLRPILERARQAATSEIETNGLMALLDRYSARLKVDAGGRAFGLDAPHEHWLELGRDTSFVLIPSVFAWPHIALNCDEPWPRGLVVPVPLPGVTVRAPTPPHALARRLRALGNPTTLQLVRLLADRPRSTQELAPLLSLTEQGVSKQLRQLASSGLVEARRTGYYVVYTLRPEELTRLGDDVDSYLESPLVPIDRPPRDTGPAATRGAGRRGRHL